MTAQAWYCTPKAKIAHCYDPFDIRWPMRALCGHKEEPQRLFYASGIEQHQERPANQAPPIYCKRCLRES